MWISWMKLSSSTMEFITLLSKSLSLAETELVLIITTGTVFISWQGFFFLASLWCIMFIIPDTLFSCLLQYKFCCWYIAILTTIVYSNLAMDYGIILIKIYRILEARVIRFRVLLIISDSTRDRFEFRRSSTSSRTNSKIERPELIRKTVSTSDKHLKSRSRPTRIPCWFHLFSS